MSPYARRQPSSSVSTSSLTAWRMGILLCLGQMGQIRLILDMTVKESFASWSSVPFTSTPCGSTTSDFESKNTFLSIRSSALKRGTLHHWPPNTGAANTRVLTCGLKAHAAKTHATPFRARSTATQGANHINCAVHIIFYLSLIPVIIGSVVFQDFLEAFVDVFSVDFSCEKVGQEPLSIRCSCNFRGHGRKSFQRHCNFC